MKKLYLTFFSFALFASMSASAIPTLNIDANGQLLGASGVDVGGALFDVEFLDGTCSALFGGCDEASDFTFQTAQQSQDAAQALLDQVLLNTSAGLFDTEPFLTRGCEASGECNTFIPFGVPSPSGVSVVNLFNINNENSDTFFLGSVATMTNLVISPAVNYARFTLAESVVSEPHSLALLGLGMVGLLGFNCRKQRQQFAA